MFNSRNPAFRSPTGAVPEGTPVHFRITLPRGLCCTAARLVVTGGASGAREESGMFWCGMNGTEAEFWECHFAPPKPGLYFYTFSLDTCRGVLSLACGGGGEGILGEGEPWQLTAYARGARTPEWFGGVVYQIFPDRFRASGKPKQNVPADRKLHASWGGQPVWEADASGKITNGDYFGGDLAGVTEKLPYLRSLGVTCVYLNPIFEAHSNHRYDTADYRRIDPLLGDEADFRKLCAEAEKLGIRIMLDGVFNHTGSDSVYFNREGRYPAPGAYQSQNSPYYPWYRFRAWPDDYECWWDFLTLPRLNQENPDYRRFVSGPDGVVRHWLRAGASAWRLDVADELSDAFLDELCAAARGEKPDAAVIGEVWEDASNKIAYGRRRRYLLGGQLDGVMNYPFRSAVLGFLTGKDPAEMMEIVLSILENYPPQTIRCLMNNIGTHDTERALTVLAGEPLHGHGRRWQSTKHLSPAAREHGLALMRLASLMQFTLPGVPCIYYGDEAGMEGYRDPFNRGCFPWGKEDAGLTEWYGRLGALRKQCACLRGTEFRPIGASGDGIAYLRPGEGETLLCAFNRGTAPITFAPGPEWSAAQAVLGPAADGAGRLTLPPVSCAALLLREKEGT